MKAMLALPAHLLALAVVVLSLVVGGCGSVSRPDGGSGLLPVGSRAPEVTGRKLDGSEVTLLASKGKPVVVFFYPKDGTPGCTKEACAFRDAWKRYEAAGVVVLGVSTDSLASHAEFQKNHELPFALASDESGALGKGYGVPTKPWGYARVSFLVDRAGAVAHVWPDVDPGVHADEVLARVAALR